MAGRHLLIAGTFLLALLLYVDRVCISAAKGPMCHDLGLTDREFGWALSSFALGYALGQSPAGWLADRYGPRLVLAAVVVGWSAFTGLTGVVGGLAGLLTVRFLFGVGEAGAFPGMARAVYAWVPLAERGVAQGVNFAGGRLGAAVALPAVAWLVGAAGWRAAFAVLMVIGFAWAAAWWVWFRDDPADHPRLSAAEREYILATRQPAGPTAAGLTATDLLGSAVLWRLMAQYFCSNFTFFFCLSWLHPHLRATYQLDPVTAGWYAAAPFVGGACGNVLAGWVADRLFRAGHWRASRTGPAVAGFLLAAGGLLAGLSAGSALEAVAWLTLAVFGTDMTITPSWAACVDVGRRSAGLVSGTMNMAGNLGSFVTSLAFPYLLAWTGSPRAFFLTAAALCGLAAVLWLGVRPDRPIGGDR
jgi:ACS family glucarate transporter-like MFS transporter